MSLVQIGSSAPEDKEQSPLQLLLACHERIRRFLSVAERLASATEGQDAHDVDEAARNVARYFTEGLPLHESDEEDGLLPLLRSTSVYSSVARALQQMTADHTRIHALLGSLQPLWLKVAEDPAARRELATREALSWLHELRQVFTRHLELEETVIFPTIQHVLTQEERRRLLADMRGRRAGDRH